MSEMPNDHLEQQGATLPGQTVPTSCDFRSPECQSSPMGPCDTSIPATPDAVAPQEAPSELTPASDLASPRVSTPLIEGSIIRAKVTEVTPMEVHFEVASQYHGSVPFIEFAGHPTPKEGDEVSVVLEKFDPANATLVLSKRHADEELFWQTVKPGELLEGVVTGMNKGGLDIDIGGARAFLPASHVDIVRMKDISLLIGEHIRCLVSQVDRTTKDLIVSRRKYLEKERKEARQKMLASLVAGERRKGVVANIVEYGAFVDLGGDVDGLIHSSELSWSHIRHVSDILKVGQEIEVLVLGVDLDKGKVSLGLKQLKPDPWLTVDTKYPVGSHVRGKVLRLADFGAFMELEEDVQALLPLSEMSWSRRMTGPGDVVKIGDELEVVILRVEKERQRISVGLKQLEPAPWTMVETKFPVNTTVKGKVSKIMEFGAFVELIPGVEGLVHISELSATRVKAVSDVVKEGQEVEVRIIKIDLPAQRISLSMRPAPPAVPAAAEQPAHKAKQTRKKPLRGGLSSHFEWLGSQTVR